jgi:hypothetical protein
MFDLTKEITLDKINLRLYRRLQLSLYLAAILAAFYLAHLILFPSQNYFFSFVNPNSSQNNITSPTLKNEEALPGGKISAGDMLTFDTTLTGDYSKAKISLTLNKKSAAPDSLALTVRKSYQAFFYDEGAPLGFKNGSLLENNNNFYIISDGQLRKFQNANVLEKLGYSTEDFLKVADEEMRYNSTGADIGKNENYPNQALFKINGNYYILENQQLKKFVSDQAYLSQYSDNQALAKDSSFLNTFPVSKDLAGFADGTLLANGTGAYIQSQGKIFPINNAATFLAKGFQWERLISAGEDEIALYEKTKLFKISDPHPDGIIFETQEDSAYYLIRDGKKHLLPGPNIAASWLGKNAAVPVLKRSLAQTAECVLQKNNFNASDYSCDIPITGFSGFLGQDFEFSFSAKNDAKIDSLSVSFSKDMTNANFRSSVKGILNRIISTYAPNAPTLPIQ